MLNGDVETSKSRGLVTNDGISLGRNNDICYFINQVRGPVPTPPPASMNPVKHLQISSFIVCDCKTAMLVLRITLVLVTNGAANLYGLSSIS